MSRVNLLPQNIKKGQETRRRTLLIAIIGAAVIAAIVAFWVFQGMRLGGVNDDIQAQQQTNQALQSDIAGLQSAKDLQTEAQQQEQLLSSAYANEVSFAGQLVDVSKVIPSDTYLTSYTATVDTTATADTTTGDTATFVGTITFSGATLHFDSISKWLGRLESVEGWANPWTSNIAQDPNIAGSFTFDTTVDLTQDALTTRGKAGEVTTGG